MAARAPARTDYALFQYHVRVQPALAGLFRDVNAFSRYSDYSYDGAMHSFEDSLHRFGAERIDIVRIRDADRRNHGAGFDGIFRAVMDGACRALVQEPKILLAGEPIASLDPRNSAIVMDSLRRPTGKTASP